MYQTPHFKHHILAFGVQIIYVCRFFTPLRYTSVCERSVHNINWPTSHAIVVPNNPSLSQHCNAIRALLDEDQVYRLCAASDWMIAGWCFYLFLFFQRLTQIPKSTHTKCYEWWWAIYEELTCESKLIENPGLGLCSTKVTRVDWFLCKSFYRQNIYIYSPPYLHTNSITLIYSTPHKLHLVWFTHKNTDRSKQRKLQQGFIYNSCRCWLKVYKTRMWQRCWITYNTCCFGYAIVI